MKLKSAILAFVAALMQGIGANAGVSYVPASVEPPFVQREFRGLWVATIANIDWPSQPGLPVEQQKRELVAILDRAADLNFNAIIFQVRPSCDTLYQSSIEPWSYYLTGEMGRAPSPFYDPLAFAVEQAHKRGMELHAWFSPYRASYPNIKPSVAASHITKMRPNLARKAGDLLWLDPGEKEVREYTMRVVMDVVGRYDIDGVHFDDRLGYPEPDAQYRPVAIADEGTYRRYRADGGRLGKDDWRRENVNALVSQTYFSIKATKPWVKFGIAPFGIWQTGYPASVRGQSSVSVLYTDSRKWLANGWVDYLSPQLYWAVDAPEQRFPVLLKWWQDQNVKHRHVWPGLDLNKVGGLWKTDETLRQISVVRNQSSSAAGEVVFRANWIVNNRGGISTALSNGVYSKPALIPASPWLEKVHPGKPSLEMEGSRATWEMEGAEQIAVWVLQTRTNGQWQTRILPWGTRSVSLGNMPDVVAVTAIDRCGVASPPVILEKKIETTPGR